MSERAQYSFPKETREFISDLLDGSQLEIYPGKNILEKIPFLDKNKVVTVTSSAEAGIEPTISLSESLSDLGFKVKPHLAAGNIEKTEFESLLGRLKRAEVTRIVAIGGDNERLSSRFDSTVEMLGKMIDLGFIPQEIDFAGYPQGHNIIPIETLDSVLLQKQEFADKFPNIKMRIITQTCLDETDFQNWAHRIKNMGIKMPIVFGFPGPITIEAMRSFLVNCALKDALKIYERFIANSSLIDVIKGRIAPEKLIEKVFRELPQKEIVTGFHIFTLNNLKKTFDFINEAKETLTDPQ